MTDNYIYIDYNSCGIVLPEVEIAIKDMISQPLNPSSTHYLGQKASGYLETSREIIKEYLGCGNTYDVMFTSTGSEANNLIINNLMYYEKKIFDIWICTAGEHKSVLQPILNKENHFIISLSEEGIVNEKQLYDFLSDNLDKKIFLSIICANNETGAINFLPEIIKQCRAIHQNLIIHSDFGQAIGKIASAKEDHDENTFNLNISELDLDAVTIIGYKFGAMVGAAALVYKKNLNLTQMIVGGSQENNLRAGTENVMAVHSIGIALDNQPSRENTRILRDYFEFSLMQMISEKDLIIFSQNVLRIGNTSYFVVKELISKAQLIYYHQEKIYLGSGSACSVGLDEESHVLTAMGYPPAIRKCAVRASFGYKNIQSDVDKLLEKLGQLYKKRVKYN